MTGLRGALFRADHPDEPRDRRTENEHRDEHHRHEGCDFHASRGSNPDASGRPRDCAEIAPSTRLVVTDADRRVTAE